MPVSEPIVASAGALLIQRPPDIVLDSAMLLPTHTADGPVDAGGWVFTVTAVVALQPVGNE